MRGSSRRKRRAERNDRLNEWFAARWKEQLEFSPIQKTVLGMKEDNDKIDDFSESAADEQLAWLRRRLRR